MKSTLVTSCVGLLALTLASGCGSPGSHAKDSGTDSGATGGTDGGTESRVDGSPDVSADGGPDGGSCPAAGTCGGNIVGTWNITSSCLDVDVSGVIPADCPTATTKPVNFQLTGTITYKADLTYSKQSTFNGGVAITYPSACLTTGDGGAQSCADLTQQLQLDVTYSAVTCVAAGSGCTCTGTLTPTIQNKTGMYTATPAGLLIETETGRAGPDMSNYCVMGSTLTTSPHAMAPSASGTITATRVATPDAGADAPSDGGGDAGTDAKPDVGPEAGTDAAGAETGADAGSDASTGN